MKVFGLLAFATAAAVTMATPIVERAPPQPHPHHYPSNPNGFPLDPCSDDKKLFNKGVWMPPVTGPWYELNCDSTIDATLTAQSGSITNEDCMKLCSNTDGCQGVVITAENACSLSSGGAGNLAKADGISAWVATSIAVRSVASQERGEPPSYNPPLDPCADSANNFLNWTAPGGRTYQLQCNTTLDVTTYISGPDDNARCMMACDSTDDCLGVFQPTGSGDCFFALGQSIGVSSKQGSAAWLPTYLLPSLSASTKRGLNDTHTDKSVCLAGQTVSNPYGGENMQVVCNYGVLATNLLTYSKKGMTFQDCLINCRINDCVGVYLYKSKYCIVGTGVYNGLTPMDDATALIPTSIVLKERSLSVEGKAVESIREERDSSYCPSMNGRQITDASGSTYEISCDITLAGLQTLGTGMTADQCLTACDDQTDCIYATLQPSGECGSLTNPVGPVMSSSMTGATTFKLMLKSDPRSLTDVEKIDKRQLAINSFDYGCTYAGDEAPISDIENAYRTFCWNYDGIPVSTDGTWVGKSYTVNGRQIWAAVHATPGAKSVLINYNDCIWGFEAVRDSCSPDAQGSQGGYAWFYEQFTTYLIGINGNTPDPCNGSC